MALRRLVPPLISWEVAGPETALDPLRGGEGSAVARAVAKRQREFRAGRHCAHRALAGLGVSAASLPAGEDRAPVWPPGVAGSISHSGGAETLALAVVALVRDWRSLGVDLEVRGATGRIEGAHIATVRDVATKPLGMERVDHTDAVFTTKEAAYKALYPLSRRFLGFMDVDVELEGDRFRATLVEPSSHDAVTSVEGVWMATASWTIALALVASSDYRT